jgi:hypothetical protein
MFFDLAVGWVAKLYKTIRYQSNWPTSILRDCLQKKKKKNSNAIASKNLPEWQW